MISACGALPSAGPSSRAFDGARWESKNEAPSEDGSTELDYVMVDVNRKVIETLAKEEDVGFFKGAFTDRSPPANVPLGLGDVIRITIFEAGPGGLFAASSSNVAGGGNYVTLPDQEVDQTGHISVPYAGKNEENGLIKVDGLRVSEVQHDIQKRLMNKAIEPQVIVTLVKRTSNLYSVIGDVGAPGRFSLDHGGIRILDALSTAGGPKGSDYNTLVTLQRGTTSATARLSTVLRESDNNIFVQPGDLLAVKKDERYYNVLGAAKTNNRVAFESEVVTVADAIAKAGGLDREVAQPAMVVIFRREEIKTLTNLGVNIDGHKGDEALPTIYRLDLTDPKGMFLAQKMQLHSNDAVYVSTHTFSDITKLLGALRDILLIKFIKD